MSKISIIHPDRAADFVSGAFSDGVLVGDLLFVSGQASADKNNLFMSKLIRINPADNVYVVCSSIFPGDTENINGNEITFNETLGLGHKVAACHIFKGEKIIKFGVPIGSATADISVGSHVHLHNLKSDYLSTYTLTNEFIQTK